MVRSCVVAWVSLVITLAAALAICGLVGDDRAGRELIRMRTQQRRLAGNGMRSLIESLQTKLGLATTNADRRLHDDGDAHECVLPSGANKANALDWYTLSHKEAQKSDPNGDHDFFPCLNDISKDNFVIVLSALYFRTMTSKPVVVDVPGYQEFWWWKPLYLDDAAKEHTVVYSGGDGKWKVAVVSVKAGVSSRTIDSSDFPGARKDCEDAEDAEACGFFEIAAEDVVCVPAQGVPDTGSDEEACKVRVAGYMKSLKALEPEIGDEKPAYCQVSAVIAGANSEDDLLEWLNGLPEAQCDAAICGDDAESKIDYNREYACRFQSNKTVAFTVLLLVLSFYFVLMGVVADGYLVPALVQIGRGLKMSDALLGATLLAFGGAANDLMTGFVSALGDAQKNDSGTIDEGANEDVKLWLGSVFGTGFFCNTLVAAMVMLFAPGEGIPVKSAVFTRDISFRLLAVGLMITFGFMGYVNTVMACFMVLCYIIYVLITLKESNANQMVRALSMEAGAQPSMGSAASVRISQSFGTGVGGKGSVIASQILAGNEDATQEYSETRDSDESKFESCGVRVMRHLGWDEESNLMDKINFVLSLPLRPFFVFTMATTDWDPLVHVALPFTMSIFIPYANPFGSLYDGIEGVGGYLVILLFWALGAGLSFVIWSATKNAPGKYISPMAFYWGTFLTALLWMALIANEIVGAMQTMGVIMGMKPMAMGITMLSWGNCVDNVFATIGLAKAGEFAVAITGIYAAPMFNVLMGNGSILIMLTIMKGGSTPFIMTLCPKILLGSLMVILVLTIVYAQTNNWRVTKTLGVLLGISYPILLTVGFIAEG